MSYQDIKSFEQESREKSEEIERLKALITELCDALEEEYGSIRGDGHMSNLLIRARDAAK